jgi:hypothetical protein
MTDSERREYTQWRDDPRTYEEMLEGEKTVLQAWIRMAVRTSEAKRTESSYVVKHDFGRDGFFVTAVQFEGALLSAGYEAAGADRFRIDALVAAPFRSDTYAGFCLEHLDSESRAEYVQQLRKAVAERERWRSAERDSSPSALQAARDNRLGRSSGRR